MKRQGGFTLIELVVVIVILGILAVTAAPRFLNLQGDARNAALEGLAGAINGASSIVYAKSAIDGNEAKDSSSVKINATDSVDTAYGYPKAATGGIDKAIEGFDANWAILPTSTATVANITLTEISGAAGTCFLTYTQATSTAVATVKVDTNACK
uniref:type II secretion system protein n=1 Tax=Thaumasiovibrio occultus TaxID=1891184 RepID=UPI000B351385|nr:type II secretion system protein [Thaumasiovibrio occultus]